MNKIRSKIILILVLIVFLPMIPISLVVFDLINQSYRIGVNSQVRQALETGLSFSKMIYDIRRQQLSEEVNHLSQFISAGREQVRTEMDQILEREQHHYWNRQDILFFNEAGEEIWRIQLDSGKTGSFDVRMLRELESGEKERLIISNRSENIYTAIQKTGTSRYPEAYLVIQAAIDPQILQQSDYLLDINQIYQSLDLRRTDLMHSFYLAFVLMGALLISLAVLAGIWISSRITSPISEVVAATAELGRGNLDYRLPVSGRRDEVGQLREHFNRMAEQLKENQERMIYLEKRAAWQQMARKIAHEIKNPLTPIQLTIQQLVDTYNGPGEDYRTLLTECAQIINEEIGSLRHLVSEFSEFGRMPELQLEKGDLNDVMREISTLYSGRVELNLDENIPEFEFDYDRLRRVLINLVENAVQADPSNRLVRLESKHLDNKILLFVLDQGEGIPAENLRKIFEPYFSTKKSGTGLGLAISRLIVEEHGGTIRVQSETGKGSDFILEFPLKGSEKNE